MGVSNEGSRKTQNTRPTIIMLADCGRPSCTSAVQVFLENHTHKNQEPQEDRCGSLQIKLLAAVIQDVAITRLCYYDMLEKHLANSAGVEPAGFCCQEQSKQDLWLLSVHFQVCLEVLLTTSCRPNVLGYCFVSSLSPPVSLSYSQPLPLASRPHRLPIPSIPLPGELPVPYFRLPLSSRNVSQATCH